MRAIVVSFAVHAGVAAGMVAAGRGGHAPPGPTTAMTADVLEIDMAVDSVDVPVKQDDRVEHANVVAPPPDHTHPYPVAGHDARPHDPSQPHDHAPAGHDDDHDHDSDHDHDRPAAGPSEAAPVVAQAGDAKMPVFAIASGNGSMTAGSTRVASPASPASGASGDGTTSGAGAGAEPASVTYAVNAVSAAAKLVTASKAAYPADARADDVEGDVGLEIVVDVEGRVVDARVVKRGGHGFDESALAAIRLYRFSAAQRDGRSVRVRMPWTVQFRLR